MNEPELKKITSLFENMSSAIIDLTKRYDEQDKKIQYLEAQLSKSLDLNAEAIETVVNRFQTPIEDFGSKISDLEDILVSMSQYFVSLKNLDIQNKLQVVDGMFNLLVDLPLINLKILSIFMEFNSKMFDDSLDEEYIVSKNNQLRNELLEYNNLYGKFIELTRQNS